MVVQAILLAVLFDSTDALALDTSDTRWMSSGTPLEPARVPAASAQLTSIAVDWDALDTSSMISVGAPAIPSSSNTYIANLEDSCDLFSVVTADTGGNSPDYSVSGGCGSFAGSVFTPSSQASCKITITTPGLGTNYLDSTLIFDASNDCKSGALHTSWFVNRVHF